MGNTLKDDMAVDAAYRLNTDEFAETGTFFPGGGGAARTITALVREVTRDDTAGVVAYVMEEITVTVMRDESHAKGGVATTAHGAPGATDRWQRSCDADTSSAFAFTGQITREQPHQWTLHFERSTAYRIGNAHRQQR